LASPHREQLFISRCVPRSPIITTGFQRTGKASPVREAPTSAYQHPQGYRAPPTRCSRYRPCWPYGQAAGTGGVSERHRACCPRELLQDPAHKPVSAPVWFRLIANDRVFHIYEQWPGAIEAAWLDDGPAGLALRHLRALSPRRRGTCPAWSAGWYAVEECSSGPFHEQRSSPLKRRPRSTRPLLSWGRKYRLHRGGRWLRVDMANTHH